MTELSQGDPIAGPTSRLRALADVAGDLLLRPERYFRSMLEIETLPIPWGLVWICGMARVIDRLDMQLATGRIQFEHPMLQNWGTLWVAVILGGVLWGPLTWLLAGWWYRVRLNFCGARGVNKRHARIVYMHTSMVWCAPLLIWLVLVTPLYPDYRAAYNAEPLSLVFVTMAPWSFWVSYRAVRAMFDVRPGWAKLWFLILPLAVFGVVILGFTALAFVNTL